MKYLLVAISTMGALALALVCPSSASAQAKAQSPAQALVNLYQAAQQIIKDPAGDYEKGKNPDFPYPSQMQAQWDASMVAYGNSLSTQERALFPACAAHLNAAITDMEIGQRIKVNQPTEAAQQEAQTRFSEAPGEAAQCSAAIELAQSEIGSTPSQPQQGVVDANGANESAHPAAPRVSRSKGSRMQTAAMEAQSPAVPPKLPFPGRSIGLRFLTHSKLISPTSGNESSMTPRTAVGLRIAQATLSH
jgi:hypothetical protein